MRRTRHTLIATGIGACACMCLTIPLVAGAGAERSAPAGDQSLAEVERLLQKVLGSDDAQSVITPMGSDGNLLDNHHGGAQSGLLPISAGGTGVIPAADNIVDLQCPNGGFDWPYGGCDDTFFNITAPITMGLLRAYEATGDATYLDATIDGANHDLNDTWSYGGLAFSSFDPMWLVMLSDVTGDPSWADIAQDDFFERLSLGTYGDAPGSCGGTDYFPGDTDDYIERHKCERSGSSINLRPWDMQYMPYVAGQIGFAGQQDAFINDSILDGLNNLDENIQWVEAGLAGGVHALALVNHSSFPAISAPNYSLIDGIDNLCDLADALAGEQDVDGSWVGSTQFTVYAVLALEAAQDAGCGPYEQEIEDGVELLWSLQDSTDGAFWSGVSQSSKNIQVQGDVLMALAGASELALNTDECATDGTVTVDIDKSETPGIEVYGGQFFLEYDTSVLSNPSVSGGDAPFDGAPFFVDIDTSEGTIDIGTAGGDPFDPQGTEDAVTMAVITFDALEVCTESDLVTFRPHTPPTQLTDGFGNPVLPALEDLPDVTIDETPPVFVSVPDDITVPADAGVCSADLDIMPEGWELDVNARIVDGAVELRSVDGDPEGPWGPTGSVFYEPTSPLEFEDITELSADFNMLDGCIVGGSPRFAIGIDSDGDGDVNGYVVAHWGPEGSPWNDCPSPGWNNTGDLTASADSRWEGAQLGGGTSMTYTEVANLIDGLPNSDVLRIIIPLDGSWSQDQIMLVDNIQIGAETHTFAGSIGNATAVDNCDDDPVITPERDDQQPLDAPYPTGDTVITWTATDACGNFDTAETTVTVLGVNEMVVDVSLQATVESAPFDRCVTFELTDANGNVIEAVEQTVTFTNGEALGIVVDVPCGDYGTCIQTRDELHTLRSTGDLDTVGTEYIADGFDPLRGGDLNDDGVVDILDFGIFVSQFGQTVGADTPCGTPGPHADITGDGQVSTGDFDFITGNFLNVDAFCPGAIAAGNLPQPRTRISVRELHEMGLGHLEVADLTGDGWVGPQDIAAFAAGERPK